MEISKIFYFVLILNLILLKVIKFLVEKLSTLEVISQKPHGGGGGGGGLKNTLSKVLLGLKLLSRVGISVRCIFKR